MRALNGDPDTIVPAPARHKRPPLSASPAGSTEPACCYEALTIQLLRLRGELYRGGGLSKEQFDLNYLGGLGEYERALAAREGIELVP